MRRGALIVILTAGSMVGLAQPQTVAPPPVPSFEVASIKRAAPIVPGPDGTITMMTRPGSAMPGGRWLTTNATLMVVLRQIYPEYRQPSQIVGAPDWVTQVRFDINAKAEGDPPRDQIVLMVKQLLADRFKLKAHTEMREVDVYALVLARSDGRLGPGMRKPQTDCRALNAARARGEAPPPAPARPGERRPCSMGSSMTNGLMRLAMPDTLVGSIGGMLQATAGRAIVDRTGLTDRYDIELQWAFSSALSASADAAATDSGPTLFSALQDQLGLKLELRKEQAEILVIDHVEMPSPD